MLLEVGADRWSARSVAGKPCADQRSAPTYRSPANKPNPQNIRLIISTTTHV